MLNSCIIAGHLVSNAIAKGTRTRVLLFTVETHQRSNEKNGDIVSFAPCCWFKAPQEVERKLTSAGKGQFILLQGRINCSIYMVGQQSRSNTEIIVFPNSVVLDPSEIANRIQTKEQQ